MTSDRQIAANRRNAARSTGPQSEEGKATSSRNALQHGLTINLATSPARQAEVERFVLALAGDQTDESILHYAREVAECHVEVLRVWQAKVAKRELFESHVAISKLMPGETAADRFENGRTLLRIAGGLVDLVRYEKRAAARQRRAIRAFDAAKAKAKAA